MADTQPLKPILHDRARPYAFPGELEGISSAAPPAKTDTPFNIPAKIRTALTTLAAALVFKTGQLAENEALSLDEARKILGEQTLNSLAGSLSLTGGLHRNLKGYRFQGAAFWEHAVATANLAWGLARAVDYPYPAQAYAAGMIHDIGKIILEPWIERSYSQIVELMWKEKLFLWQAEVHVFGLDHAAAGAHLCERRRVPTPIGEAVRWHHMPEFATRQAELAALVNLADALAPQETLGLSGLNHKSIHPPTLRILSLERSAMEQLRRELLDRSQWVWPNQ
jgi:putative nucleotidyltransferase with HDIG domain